MRNSDRNTLELILRAGRAASAGAISAAQADALAALLRDDGGYTYADLLLAENAMVARIAHRALVAYEPGGVAEKALAQIVADDLAQHHGHFKENEIERQWFECASSFVKTLLDQPDDAQLIELPKEDGMQPTHAPRLFVRACYHEIIKYIEAYDARQTTGGFVWSRQFIVTGTHGIGKSAFLVVLLRHYLRKGLRVAWHPRDRHIWVLSRGARPFTVEKKYLGSDVADVYLTNDSDPVTHFGGLTIAAASAGEASRRLEKTATALFMPAWSEDELLEAARLGIACEEHVCKNFELWGGIPRYVFCSPEVSLRKAKDFIVRAGPNPLKKVIMGYALSYDAADWLCIFEADDEFRFTYRSPSEQIRSLADEFS